VGQQAGGVPAEDVLGENTGVERRFVRFDPGVAQALPRGGNAIVNGTGI
jgi:hypothetical protein